MTRIIAGTGARTSLDHSRFRHPTHIGSSARSHVRQHRIELRADGRTWSDVSVCDLWAGSGAIALEAWSRGATRVLAIDQGARTRSDVIAANIRSVDAHGVPGVARERGQCRSMHRHRVGDSTSSSLIRPMKSRMRPYADRTCDSPCSRMVRSPCDRGCRARHSIGSPVPSFLSRKSNNAPTETPPFGTVECPRSKA